MKETIVLPGYVDDMPFSLGYEVKGGATTLYLSGATAYPLYYSHPAFGWVANAEQSDESDAGMSLPNSIKEQTQIVLENLKIVIEAAGGTINDIVKTTIFNKRMDLQDEVNEVYNAFFAGHRPARSHIGVADLVSPDLLIEIEAIAVLND
ncbi:RidA family protein [Paenibacillus beijingensis]|uniref:Translation initiation inhibitor n=1 Tax=Paenibacillus beijingensis TaxID=1126833 RepID=A0A0D5NIK0_9BACL|nr:RidA family protein [Paenibacillus beijingensis]AJY75189.1 translation initiation inhibitor [Paenibacillus beijingensis]